MNKMEPENRGIDDQLFQQIVIRSQHAPALRTMEIGIAYLDNGIAGLIMYVQQKFENARGLLHGGVVAALADTAMGYAIQSLGFRSVTIDININYCAPATAGTELHAEGCVLQVGKTIIVAEAVLSKGDEKLMAKSRGTFLIIPVD